MIEGQKPEHNDKFTNFFTLSTLTHINYDSHKCVPPESNTKHKQTKLKVEKTPAAPLPLHFPMKKLRSNEFK